MKDYIPIYGEKIEILSELTNKQVGKLFKLLIEYSKTDKVPIDKLSNDPLLKISFYAYKGDIDRKCCDCHVPYAEMEDEREPEDEMV